MAFNSIRTGATPRSRVDNWRSGQWSLTWAPRCLTIDTDQPTKTKTLPMRIEITYTPHPTKAYTATIWDGPDGIDEDSFVCRSLGECFEQIVMWRTLNAQQYRSGD